MDENHTDESLDDFLDDEDRRIARALSSVDIDAIDTAILALARDRWQKVALIVGTVLTDQGADGRIPLGVLVRRVGELVERGDLQSQGDVRRMRHSEVRLPVQRPRRPQS
jgi:hypothetical protein